METLETFGGLSQETHTIFRKWCLSRKIPLDDLVSLIGQTSSAMQAVHVSCWTMISMAILMPSTSLRKTCQTSMFNMRPMPAVVLMVPLQVCIGCTSWVVFVTCLALGTCRHHVFTMCLHVPHGELRRSSVHHRERSQTKLFVRSCQDAI